MALTLWQQLLVERAVELEKQMDKLSDEQDELLNEVCVGFTKLSVKELGELVKVLPKGFYRTEVKTELNKRYGL